LTIRYLHFAHKRLDEVSFRGASSASRSSRDAETVQAFHAEAIKAGAHPMVRRGRVRAK